jgi:Outer membrane protein beta-barrel domain
VITVPPPEAPPAPSQAEPVPVPAVEIKAGYSILWDDGLSPADGNAFFDLGWVLSGTANLSRNLGVVGEVSGHYDWGETIDVAGVPLDLDLGVLGVHAGLRYSHRGGGPIVPYVQALAGWTRTGAEVAGVREFENAFSIQPGAGVQLRLTTSLGLALGGDYRLVFGEDESRNELRLHAGLVFLVGNR